MSLDLFFWDPPPGHGDDEQVRQRFARACEEEPDEVDEEAGESEAIATFYTALTARYPDHEVGSAIASDSPWASTPFDRGDRYLMLSIRFSAPDEVLGWIEELAGNNGLVMFDPQSDDVHRSAS